MSQLASIQGHLARRFSDEGQRLVFWHDETGEYEAELDALDLPNVEVTRVANNEYALKHRILREDASMQFLIYRSGPVPQGIDNWLLDLELAYGIFTADQTSLILQELDYPSLNLRDVVEDHADFFRATKRIQDLKNRLDSDDRVETILAKMITVVFGTKDHSLSAIWRVLLEENARGSDTKFTELEKYQLDSFHWQGTTTIYGYESTNPSINDFVLWLFRSANNGFKSDLPGKLRNIRIDFGSLHYDTRFRKDYEILARRASDDLAVEQQIDAVDFRDLVDNDLFEIVDHKIISELARGVADRTLLAKEVSELILRRTSGFWYQNFEHTYTAIDAATVLLTEIDSAKLSAQSFDEGLERYTKGWYRIDQLYRQFIFHARKAEAPGPLEKLRDQVEAFYSNKYLYPLGAEWQKQVDAATRWRSAAIPGQSSFYAKHVAPVITSGRNKAVVIISDALRYEAAEELASLIRREDRFDATTSAVLSVLPSYTQLGMAALLPHTTLGHAAGSKALVNVDGLPSAGTINRSKLLEPVGGVAIQAEDLIKMNRDEARELYKSHQVIYVYHNRIDETGDNSKSEGRVFEAVDDTFSELIELIKKLANANATNILITADHGFLYQDGGLDDNGYLSVEPHGDEIVYRDRRFILGRGLKPDPAFKTFSPEQLGLDSELEVQIPKSIHRLRLKGSGSRFVHGGSSLQEVVVPVLTVNKKRKSDVRPVEVQVLPESDKITTGQIAVNLFQVDPVSDKIQPRSLMAGLFVGEQLISNEVPLEFVQVSTDKRERYHQARLILSKEADGFNGRAVEFRLTEQIPGTTQRRVYQRVTYTLRRSFMTDF